jgi:hypothetical protein
MQHGLLLAGGSVAPQTSKQKHARRRTHAHAHACARTQPHAAVLGSHLLYGAHPQSDQACAWPQALRENANMAMRLLW